MKKRRGMIKTLPTRKTDNQDNNNNENEYIFIKIYMYKKSGRFHKISTTLSTL